MTIRIVKIVPILVATLVLLALAQVNAPNASAATYREYFKTGDVQCDGDVDVIDSLTILRYDAGLSTTQTEPCPEIDESVQIVDLGLSNSHINWYFGDVNCDGIVNPTDSGLILRFDAGYRDDGCGKVLSNGYLMFVTGGVTDPDGCIDMWHYSFGIPACSSAGHTVLYYWSQ